jgi:hypothetical protein
MIIAGFIIVTITTRSGATTSMDVDDDAGNDMSVEHAVDMAWDAEAQSHISRRASVRASMEQARHDPQRADRVRESTRAAMEQARHDPQRTERNYLRDWDTANVTDIDPIDLGGLVLRCPFCNAKMYNGEQRSGRVDDPASLRFGGRCCKNGKIKLASFTSPPQPLLGYLTDDTPAARKFRKHIRAYNYLFQMASTSAAINFHHRPGARFFKLGGRVVHKIGGILPPHDFQPRYLQIYTLDPDEQSRLRFQTAETIPDVEHQFVRDLQNMLHHHNPISAWAHEVAPLVNQGDECYLRLAQNRGEEARTYIMPAEEGPLRMFVPGEDLGSAGPITQQLVVYTHTEHLHILSGLSPYAAPMLYPLLFPRGEMGFSLRIPYAPEVTARGHVTEAELYNYHVQYRVGCFLNRSARLFEEYITHAHINIESHRLFWYQTHQPTLRADLYEGVMDEASKADADPRQIGKMVILPPTFHGGQRSRNQLFMDAVTIANTLGPFDLFMTFTCNLHWPEIVRELHPGQTAQDRPDLVKRVFDLRLGELKKDLLERHVLGRIVAHVIAEEYQANSRTSDRHVRRKRQTAHSRRHRSTYIV